MILPDTNLYQTAEVSEVSAAQDSNISAALGSISLMTDFTWELCHKRKQRVKLSPYIGVTTMEAKFFPSDCPVDTKLREQSVQHLVENTKGLSLPLCLAALLSLLQSNLSCPGWTGQYNSHCPKSSRSWHLYFHWHTQGLTKILEATLACWYRVSTKPAWLDSPIHKIGIIRGFQTSHPWKNGLDDNCC